MNWKQLIVEFILASLIFSIGWGFVFSSAYKDLKQQAIEHNCAEYDAKTGEWGFNK